MNAVNAVQSIDLKELARELENAPKETLVVLLAVAESRLEQPGTNAA